MSRYRRATTSGASYFFTLVTYRRQPILCADPMRNALRAAIEKVRVRWPFEIDAWVLLPDHLHCIWTLPEGDADFSTRWMLIKREVSLACGDMFQTAEGKSASRHKHRESTLWQRRFWEHQIRHAGDFMRHADCIHFNPVKHGLVAHAMDWPYSTFQRYVGAGIYAPDWAGTRDTTALDLD